MRWYLTRKPVNHEATVPNRLTSHRPFHVEWYLYMPLYQVIELQCRRSVEQIKSTRPYESRLVSRIFWTKSSMAVKPRQHLFGLKVLKSVGLSSTFVLNTGWAIWPGNENALEMMTQSPLVATQGAQKKPSQSDVTVRTNHRVRKNRLWKGLSWLVEEKPSATFDAVIDIYWLFCLWLTFQHEATMNRT